MEPHRRKGTWKLDVRAVPPLLLLWLANFIDRTNIGNARIAGLEADLHLKGLQFNTALAIFYVFYIVAEIPSNLVLKRLGGNVWLPAIVMAWGLVTTLSGLARNYAGILVLRAFLGFLEGGLLPGFAYYLSTLYPRAGIQKRIAFFYAGASLAGAFSGLLSYALTHVRTAVPPLFKWSWIFIAEGIITVGFGARAALVMPPSVQSAKALTEEERAACLAAMQEPQHPTPAEASVAERGEAARAAEGKPQLHGAGDTAVSGEEAHEWGEVFRAFTDVQVWLTGIAYLGLCNSLYSFTLFLPTILAGLYPDSDQAHIQLLTVPPFVPATVMVLVVAYYADRLRLRGPFILMLLPVSMIGYALLIGSRDNHVRYAAVFLITLGLYPSAPCILSILPNNTAGKTKRATATALQLMIANCAGFVGTFICISDEFGPNYVTSHSVVLASLVLAWVCIFANVMYCRSMNAKREAGHVSPAEERWAEDVRKGKTKAPLGDRASSFRFIL